MINRQLGFKRIEWCKCYPSLGLPSEVLIVKRSGVVNQRDAMKACNSAMKQRQNGGLTDSPCSVIPSVGASNRMGHTVLWTVGCGSWRAFSGISASNRL